MLEPSKGELKKSIGIAVALGAFTLLLFIPLPESLASVGEAQLTAQGKTSLAVLILSAAFQRSGLGRRVTRLLLTSVVNLRADCPTHGNDAP